MWPVLRSRFVLLLALGACGAGVAAPEDPWGFEQLPVPDDAALQREIDEALDLRRRREFSRLLEAREPGELREHATLPQQALDRGVFGPPALFVVGDDLFDFSFRPRDGLGHGLGGAAPPALKKVHSGEHGGPDALSCSGCHSLGGLDGAGTNTQNAFLRGDGEHTRSADERNAPHLLGLGPIAALAAELSRALQAQRDEAIAAAVAAGAPVERALSTHGVDFGAVRGLPGGTAELSLVRGVDRDLVVRPFGWKGHQATLRGMIDESFRIHLGVISVNTQRRVAAGELDPAVYGDGPPDDVDRDGVTFELDDGMLSTMFGYLAQLEVPIERPPHDAALRMLADRGRTLFTGVGCAACHRPSLTLAEPVIETRPEHPMFAQSAPVRIDVAHDGDEPKAAAAGTGLEVGLFSDLRRHDLGSELATPAAQGPVPASEFLTRPLWGLAETAPYLHDGRAPSIDDAIRLHGGEAAGSAAAYAALGAEDRAALRVFLITLSRAPRLRVP